MILLKKNLKIKFAKSFWKMVLQRLFNIILTLAKSSLGFRGHREKEGYHGNFLSVVELVARYAHILRQVLDMPKALLFTYAMEAISQSLQPYKSAVGQIASVITILQFFSGAFVCKDIYKKGSAEGIPSTPFIGGVVIGILMLKHGLLLQDPAMIQVNVVAIILNAIYTTFYYKFSTDKYKEVLQPFAIGTAIVAILLGYATVESPENLEFRFGMILTILMLMLLGAPLIDVKEIIEKKDASSIPFPITLMGAIVTFLWLVYGIILMNGFMIIQNVIGFALCTLQLVLIFLYPGVFQPKPKAKKSVKRD